MDSSTKVPVTRKALLQVLQENVNLGEMIRLTEELADMVARKNADYGDAWQTWGLFTPLVRINDKLLRLQTLGDGRVALVVDENIQDTLRDILGYAALALLWLKHEEVNQTIRAVASAIMTENVEPVDNPKDGLEETYGGVEDWFLDKRMRKVTVDYGVDVSDGILHVGDGVEIDPALLEWAKKMQGYQRDMKVLDKMPTNMPCGEPPCTTVSTSQLLLWGHDQDAKSDKDNTDADGPEQA